MIARVGATAADASSFSMRSGGGGVTKDNWISRPSPGGRQAVGNDQAGVGGSASDVEDLATARAEIEKLRSALTAAKTRERFVSNELQHRVRNMLAMIRSITRQTWEEGASQEEYAQHLQGRLDAIGRYQAHLGRGNAPGIDIEDILRDELMQTSCLDGPRCSLDGPPVRLYDRQAELFGLAVHELATNAIKFGAFAQGGSLAVKWSADDARFDFSWSEADVAVASPAPRPSGFGRRLIEEALPYQLGATTSFGLKPGGIVCTIVLPRSDAEPDSSERPEVGTAGSPVLTDDAD